ncbi:STAS domain-containing protein [Pseudonocardia nigra]|uniref:STAS domain-containing protein n=1 Tax=Pseudonocardia nigra TaxID=1921578 RepID=UPI001C5DC626|nr:STAS domain-containing protein [Pseudonocardia nigra]
MPDPARHTAGPDATDELLDTRIDRPRPGVAVLAVHGEVDTLTASAFTGALEELTTADEPVLVVDLTGVTFLASTGLAALIQAARRAEERALRLRLVAPARAVRRPLEITGTDQLFEIHADVIGATAGSD